MEHPGADLATISCRQGGKLHFQVMQLLRAIFGWILKGLFLNNSITQLTQKQAVEGFKPLTHEEH